MDILLGGKTSEYSVLLPFGVKVENHEPRN
jgi:hypothetical protein